MNMTLPCHFYYKKKAGIGCIKQKEVLFCIMAMGFFLVRKNRLT